VTVSEPVKHAFFVSSDVLTLADVEALSGELTGVLTGELTGMLIGVESLTGELTGVLTGELTGMLIGVESVVYFCCNPDPTWPQNCPPIGFVITAYGVPRQK
jgi:hypothetical protein